MSQQSRRVIPGGLIKRLFAKMWAGMGKSWARHGDVPTLSWKRGGEGEFQKPSSREDIGEVPLGWRGTASPGEPMTSRSPRALWRLPFGQIRPAGREWLAVGGVGQPQGRELGQEGGETWANRRD